MADELRPVPSHFTDTDNEERWELVVTVPPVTQSVKQMLVQCGRTTLVVERDNNGGWAGVQGSAMTKRRPDYDGAVADARTWVERSERSRLLQNAAIEALREAGESVG